MPHPMTTFSEMTHPPKKSADACLFCFPVAAARTRLHPRYLFWLPPIVASPWGASESDWFNVMGIVMKKRVWVGARLAMTGVAFAADMKLKAVKAPPPVAFDPWDLAFGSAIMNDYVFRGITQSNHKPSVAAYFEPR